MIGAGTALASRIDAARRSVNLVGGKLSAQLAADHGRAATVVGATENATELAGYNALSAAAHIAAGSGVSFPTADEMGRLTPRYPTTVVPVGVMPSLAELPPLPARPSTARRPDAAAAAAWDQSYAGAAAEPADVGAYWSDGQWMASGAPPSPPTRPTGSAPAGDPWHGLGPGDPFANCIDWGVVCPADGVNPISPAAASAVAGWTPGQPAPEGWAEFSPGVYGNKCLHHCGDEPGANAVYYYCAEDVPSWCFRKGLNCISGSFCLAAQPEPVCHEECDGDQLVKTCDEGTPQETVEVVGSCATPPPPPPPTPCCPQQPDVNVTVKTPDHVLVTFQQPDAPDPRADPGQPGKLTGVNWDQPGACEAAAASLDQVAADFSDFVKGLFPDGLLDGTRPIEEIVEERVKGLTPLLKGPAGMLLEAFYTSMRWSMTSVERGTGCADAALIKPILSKAAIEWGQRLFGIDASDVITRLNYAIHAKCPTLIPTQAELDRMYDRGELSADDWECYTRANNNLPNLARASLRAGWVKPGILEANALYRRGVIDDAEWVRMLKEIGVRHDGDREKFWELSKQLPPYSDLVRLMTRDAFDDAVAARFGYDEEFEQKFTDKAYDWSYAQGIDEDVMRYIWRAHWRLPAPGQAFQMLQRNRPGRVPDDIVVRQRDVEELLAIDDMAPWWRKRLVNISYAVMRLVDVRKQFNHGLMDRAELKEQLQDRGYDEQTSERHSKAMEAEKGEWVSGRYVARQYQAGNATRDELSRWLDRFKLDGETRRQLVDDLDYRRAVLARSKCQAGVRKRYMTGELGATDAMVALTSLGFEPGDASVKVQTWECERASKGREVTANTLCDWVGKGLISRAQMYQRLLNIGYRDLDAERIALACQIRVDDRRMAKRKAGEDAARREAEKSRRAADKAGRDAAREGAARQKAASAAGNLFEAVKLKIIQAARGWSQWAEVDERPVWDDLEAKVCYLRSRKGYSPKGAIALVVEVLKESIAAGELDYNPRWAYVTSSMADSPQDDVGCATPAMRVAAMPPS